MKAFKVIWFDDEWMNLDIIRESAILNDIELIGFSNAKDGIEELESRIDFYDAAILDGKFYVHKEQRGDITSDRAFLDVALALERLSMRKKLPWFILSGQKSFTKEKNAFADGFKGNKVYDKTYPEQLESLWLDLKREAGMQEQTQIRHRYQKVFDVCSSAYIGEEYAETLLRILLSVNNPTREFDDGLYFTEIRKMLEAIFRSANRLGLLHDACIKGGKVNLTESSLFLAGVPTNHLYVKCEKAHFPKLVSEMVKDVLFITGAAAHTVDPEVKNNLNLAEYRKSIQTPYLLYSLTFQLMDIMLWFKSYADSHPDIEQNKRLWQAIPNPEKLSHETWIKGKVLKIAENGYGTFKPDENLPAISLPPTLVLKMELNEGDSIEITTKPDPKDLSGKKLLTERIRKIGL